MIGVQIWRHIYVKGLEQQSPTKWSSMILNKLIPATRIDIANNNPLNNENTAS